MKMKIKTEKMGNVAAIKKSQGSDEMRHKEPKRVEKMEKQEHEGFYKGPHNQTLMAGREEHADGKMHEDHHPAVRMSKGE